MTILANPAVMYCFLAALPLVAMDVPGDNFYSGWVRSGPGATGGPGRPVQCDRRRRRTFSGDGLRRAAGAEICRRRRRDRPGSVPHGKRCRGPGHLPAQVQPRNASARPGRAPQRRPLSDRHAEGRLFHPGQQFRRPAGPAAGDDRPGREGRGGHSRRRARRRTRHPARREPRAGHGAARARPLFAAVALYFRRRGRAAAGRQGVSRPPPFTANPPEPTTR